VPAVRQRFEARLATRRTGTHEAALDQGYRLVNKAKSARRVFLYVLGKLGQLDVGHQAAGAGFVEHQPPEAIGVIVAAQAATGARSPFERVEAIGTAEITREGGLVVFGG